MAGKPTVTSEVTTPDPQPKPLLSGFRFIRNSIETINVASDCALRTVQSVDKFVASADELCTIYCATHKHKLLEDAKKNGYVTLPDA